MVTQLPCIGCTQFFTGVKALCDHMKRTHGIQKDAYKSTSLACLVAGLSIKDQEAQSVGLSLDGDREKFCCKLCSPHKNFSRGYFQQHVNAVHNKGLASDSEQLVDASGWVLRHDWGRYHNRSNKHLGTLFDAAVAMRAAPAAVAAVLPIGAGAAGSSAPAAASTTAAPLLPASAVASEAASALLTQSCAAAHASSSCIIRRPSSCSRSAGSAAACGGSAATCQSLCRAEGPYLGDRAARVRHHQRASKGLATTTAAQRQDDLAGSHLGRGEGSRLYGLPHIPSQREPLQEDKRPARAEGALLLVHAAPASPLQRQRCPDLPLYHSRPRTREPVAGPEPHGPAPAGRQQQLGQLQQNADIQNFPKVKTILEKFDLHLVKKTTKLITGAKNTALKNKRDRDTILVKTLPTPALWRSAIERAFHDLLALSKLCHSFTSPSTIPHWLHYAAHVTILGIIFTKTYVGRPGFFTASLKRETVESLLITEHKTDKIYGDLGRHITQCCKDALNLGLKVYLQLPLPTNTHLPNLFIHPRAGKHPYVAAKLLGKFAACHFPPGTKFTATLLRKHYSSLTDEQDKEVTRLYYRGDGHSKKVGDKIYTLTTEEKDARVTWCKYLASWGEPPSFPTSPSSAAINTATLRMTQQFGKVTNREVEGAADADAEEEEEDAVPLPQPKKQRSAASTAAAAAAAHDASPQGC
eukprot:5542050-Amphidinium_carterae.1